MLPSYMGTCQNLNTTYLKPVFNHMVNYSKPDAVQAMGQAEFEFEFDLRRPTELNQPRDGLQPARHQQRISLKR